MLVGVTQLKNLAVKIILDNFYNDTNKIKYIYLKFLLFYYQ